MRSMIGSTEKRFNSAISAAGNPTLAITCPATNCRISILRIRGSCAQDLTLKQGTSAAGATAISTPVIATQDNFDIPGVEITLDAGNNLYVDASVDETPDITFSYVLDVIHPHQAR